MTDLRKAWDPETMGYGKHDYRHIDPDTVNVAEYAKDMRGEQAHLGDVREYNSADNQKHPENDVSLDWFSRPGTVFETDAEGYQGIWMVTNQPVVKSPETFCRARRAVEIDGEWKEEAQYASAEEIISCVVLGCAVGRDNLFEQVKTKLLRKAKVDKSSRDRLTKK